MEKGIKSDTIPAIRVGTGVRQSLEELAKLDRRTLSDYIRLHLEKLAESLKSNN